MRWLRPAERCLDYSLGGSALVQGDVGPVCMIVGEVYAKRYNRIVQCKGEVMPSTNQSPQLLRIANDTIINLANLTYVELTGQGGMDLHFVGKTKALHLKAADAEALRDWVSDEAK